MQSLDIKFNSYDLGMEKETPRLGLGNPSEIGNDSVVYSETDLQVLDFLEGYDKFPPMLNTCFPLVVFGFGTIANGILIAYLIKSKKCRIPIFTLLTSLGMCDFLTCFWAAVLGTLIFPAIIPTDPFGADFICRVTMFAASLAYKSSLCHLMFLSGVRFYQLTQPLAAQARITVKWMLVRCLGIWLFCGGLSTAYGILFIPYPIIYKDSLVKVCRFHANGALKETIYLIFTLIIPTLVIAIFHLAKQWKMAKDSELTEQERRSTSSRTVSIIIVLFILSIFPRFLHTCYHSVLGFSNQPFHLGLFIYSLHISYLNSVADPFVYLISSKNIRKNICVVLFRKAPGK